MYTVLRLVTSRGYKNIAENWNIPVVHILTHYERLHLSCLHMTTKFGDRFVPCYKTYVTKFALGLSSTKLCHSMAKQCQSRPIRRL